MNRVVEILMQRDGISEAEATELIKDTQSEIYEAMEGTSCLDVDDIIASNLGLEPDYLLEILEV